MAEPQLESDPAPQRKRIAVACGRCRKRKIRCSGDPGTGQPCTNCKNAGVDECLFLRVQSREAPLRDLRLEPSEFYSMGDSRIFANRVPVNTTLPYGQELPTLSSSDVVTSYRGATTYPSYPASKPYYPAYGGPYADEFDYGLGVSSQSVIGQDGCMHPLMPTGGHWGSHAASQHPHPSPYGQPYPAAPPGHSLVHRAHAVSSEPNNFSFTGVAASLPSASSTLPERLLPNPVQLGRSSTLPYPGPHGSLKTPAPVSTTPTPGPTATLADVAAAASFVGTGNFDSSSHAGLPYTSSASHHSNSSVSGGGGGGGGGGGESIFGEQERSLQSQGSGFDLNTYTAEPRRASTCSGGHSGATLSNGQTYVPSDSGAHEVHHPIHPGVTPSTSSSQHHSIAGYAVLDSPTASSGSSNHGQNGGHHRHSQGHQSHQLHHHAGHSHSAISTGSGGNTSHVDTRTTVSSRR
ncbi:hypothetical protein V8F20_009965 [Naviculisporaceae sp. PSN 640]